MENNDEKLIAKIEKLLRLSSSNNEHEAQSAMMKAQELMAKHNIKMADVNPEEQPQEKVETRTSERYREGWVGDLATIIAGNFRCRTLLLYANKGNTYRVRFYGANDDAQICMQIFQYALEVVRSRCKTMKGIFEETGKSFEYNDKLMYCHGFMQGLQKNFKEQIRRNECYALALTVPAVVDNAIEQLGKLKDAKPSTQPTLNRKNRMLYDVGYTDGKTFQNAGDKERLHS